MFITSSINIDIIITDY